MSEKQNERSGLTREEEFQLRQLWQWYLENVKAKGPSLNNKDFLMWLLFLATMVGSGPDVLKTIVGVLLK